MAWDYMIMSFEVYDHSKSYYEYCNSYIYSADYNDMENFNGVSNKNYLKETN